MKRLAWFLFIIIGIGLIIALSIPKISGDPSVESAVTTATMTHLQVALASYTFEYNSLPDTTENYKLAKILTGENPKGIVFLEFREYSLNANRDIIDGWGTPFRIEYLPEHSFVILSAGPDLLFGTDDDYKYERKTKH